MGSYLASKASRTTTLLVNYVYDNLGQLRSVVDNAGLNLSYSYDAQGRQIGKVKNGALNRGLIYRDQLRPAAELNPNGSLKSVFVYGSRGHVPEFMDRAGVSYRFVTDHLGSVSMVVNLTTKEIAQKLTYSSWGQVIADSNPGFQPFGYAGGIYDHETRLVRFGARDYDASVGRWLDKDPLRFQGGENFYTYANGDPINNIDPTGLVCEFSQSSGSINCSNELGTYYQEVGYSGGHEGRNKPGKENWPMLGPTPVGKYKTGTLFHHEKTKANTRRLYPDSDTTTRIHKLGRDPKSFMIHGDNKKNDASAGCMILSPNRVIIPTGETIYVVP